jgi:ribosomal protein S8
MESINNPAYDWLGGATPIQAKATETPQNKENKDFGKLLGAIAKMPSEVEKPSNFKKKGVLNEVIQFKPNLIVKKTKFTGIDTTSGTKTPEENSLKNLTGEASGYMNINSAKPLKKRTANLALAFEHAVGFETPLVGMANGKEVDAAKQKYVKPNTQKPYLTFVTLTLPAFQRHLDVELTDIFNEQFIRTMREQWGVQQYVWRKEPQADTGAVHFHVLCDRYIDWKIIRKRWNNIMDEHGYIESFRKRQLNHNSYNHKIALGMAERKKIAKKLVEFVKYARKTGKLSTVTIPEAKAYVQKQVGKTTYYGPEKAMQDAEAIQLGCFDFRPQLSRTEKNMASFKSHVKNTLSNGHVNPKCEPELKQLLFRLVKQGKKLAQSEAIIKANYGELKKIDHDIQYRQFKANVANNFSDPNSTDVHKIQNLKSVTAYLGKYIAKESEIDTSWIDFKTQRIEKRVMRVEQRIKNITTNQVESR